MDETRQAGGLSKGQTVSWKRLRRRFCGRHPLRCSASRSGGSSYTGAAKLGELARLCCVITICVPPDVPKMTDGGWSGLSATTSMVVTNGTKKNGN